MEAQEGRALVRQAVQQIKTTTDAVVGWSQVLKDSRQMRSNEDAQIYLHLEDAFSSILNPEVFPSLHSPQGHSRTIRIGEHSLSITVTHRAKNLEDIRGIDVIYNLFDWKGLAFQHKKRLKNGRIHFGKEENAQRKKIQTLCGICGLSNRFNEEDAFLVPYCSSLYVIGDTQTELRQVASACRMNLYLEAYPTSPNDSDTLPFPPELPMIDLMFLQCMVGRRLASEEETILLSAIEDVFMAQPDIVFKAHLQHNTEIKLEDILIRNRPNH